MGPTGGKSCLFCACGVDYSGELLCDERSSADKTAVDIGLSEQLCGVLVVHRSAVLDNDSVRGVLAVKSLDKRTDNGADLVRLLGSCGLARADSPDGLVGDDDVLELISGYAAESYLGLRADYLREVMPSLRSERTSPTQRMTFRPSLRAALTRLRTVTSVSPKYCLRSLWPMIT